MAYKCFISKHQQALLAIMFFTMSFAGIVEPYQRGELAIIMCYHPPYKWTIFSFSLDGGKQQHHQHHHHQHHNHLHHSHNSSLTSSSSSPSSSDAAIEFTINNFETMNNTHVTAQIGGTAILPCIVDASSPATVTWIRRSDYQLLTGRLNLRLSSRFALCIRLFCSFSNRSRLGHVQQRREVSRGTHATPRRLGLADKVRTEGRRGCLRVQFITSSTGIDIHFGVCRR
jgi:hypothetical protein